MPDEPKEPPTPDAHASPEGLPPQTAGWFAWLGWGWILVLVLATLAEVMGWADLRLALDFQRHFR